jgi:hypothetical protein
LPSTIYAYEQPYLEAALEQAKNFLLSNDLFWNAGLSAPTGHPPYPQLSLANILLSDRRLQAIKESTQLNPSQLDQIKQLHATLQTLQSDWQTAWQKKAELEFGLRLREFSRFLNDLTSSDLESATNFNNGLRIRALLQLLLPETLDAAISLKSELDLYDQRLKQATQAADFRWPQPLKKAFPIEDFSFLYTQKKQEN